MARAQFALILLAAAGVATAEEDPVFRSDTALVRVDVQVLDASRRAIASLEAEDFVLYEQGKQRLVRNFVREEMPIDVLFLIDVSVSMRPHVERLTEAAHRALPLLGELDRVGIMTFDRATHKRMPFTNQSGRLARDFDATLRSERFDGGTDITQAIIEAAFYIERNARPNARRAIVLLTDDQTEFERDVPRANTALTRANAVMTALLVPDALGTSRGGGIGRGGSGRGGGIGFPGGGGGWGGVILGPRNPFPQPVPQGRSRSRTRSAGSDEIARESGGDSLPADDAESLEVTLARIRQTYALHFHMPPGVREGDQRTVEVALSPAAARRHRGATLLYRRYYKAAMTTAAGPDGEAELISSSPARPEATRESAHEPVPPPAESRRRVASDGGGSRRGPLKIE